MRSLSTGQVCTILWGTWTTILLLVLYLAVAPANAEEACEHDGIVNIDFYAGVYPAGDYTITYVYKISEDQDWQIKDVDIILPADGAITFSSDVVEGMTIYGIQITPIKKPTSKNISWSW